MPRYLEINMSNPDSIIIAKNLAVSYRSKTIWRDANFEISSGEFIGLVGPNGAGKTTLFKVLLGITQPDSGHLKIFDTPPKRGNSRIGYVPQRPYVDSESRISTIEYVRLGLSGTKFGFSVHSSANERHQALVALKSVDAASLADKSLNELSGGELQRIFLAQALVGDPDILLLDEPLANLDIRRETQLVQLLSEIVQQRKIAVILIAHDINPLLPVINRIIYIANRKVASGRPDEIVTSQKLSELYNAPIEVLRGSRGQLAVLGVEEALHHDE